MQIWTLSWHMHQAFKLLAQTAAWLPLGGQVVFWADRGWADIDLLAELRRWGGHGRIRITGAFWV